MFFPDGEAEQNPSHASEPDRVFREVGLGIELTEYLPKQSRGSASRAFDVQHAQILDRARAAFEQLTNQQVFVSVSWAPHQALSLTINVGLSEQIARTVLSMLVRRTDWWQPDWSTVEGRTLGRDIGDIWIWPKSSSSEWTSAESGMVGDDVRRVQATIHGKDPFVPKYRKTCDTIWLLIVAEANISTYFSPDEDFPSAVFETAFDQVFLFDAFHGEVRTLATKHCGD